MFALNCSWWRGHLYIQKIGSMWNNRLETKFMGQREGIISSKNPMCFHQIGKDVVFLELVGRLIFMSVTAIWGQTMLYIISWVLNCLKIISSEKMEIHGLHLNLLTMVMYTTFIHFDVFNVWIYYLLCAK